MSQENPEDRVSGKKRKKKHKDKKDKKKKHKNRESSNHRPIE